MIDIGVISMVTNLGIKNNSYLNHDSQKSCFRFTHCLQKITPFTHLEHLGCIVARGQTASYCDDTGPMMGRLEYNQTDSRSGQFGHGSNESGVGCSHRGLARSERCICSLKNVKRMKSYSHLFQQKDSPLVCHISTGGGMFANIAIDLRFSDRPQIRTNVK